MNKKFGATLFRSSRSQIFFKMDLFKNFAIFIEKNFSWSLFLIKLHSWRLATWLTRDSHAGVFCEYWEICKSNVFVEHLRWLLLIFIVNTCYFKFQINKRVLLIEMMKVSSSQSKLILGDSWNYMPSTLVPSSAKRITTQILVIAKLNGREDFILRVIVCDIIRPSEELTVQS